MTRTILITLALGLAAAAAYFALSPGRDRGAAVSEAAVSEAADSEAEAVEATTLADVALPAELSAQAAMGKTIFEGVCAACHGLNAAGTPGVAPPLVHQLYRPSHHADAAIMRAARNGVQAHHWNFGNMPPVDVRLTDAELASVVRYIRELQRENGIL